MWGTLRGEPPLYVSKPMEVAVLPDAIRRGFARIGSHGRILDCACETLPMRVLEGATMRVRITELLADALGEGEEVPSSHLDLP